MNKRIAALMLPIIIASGCTASNTQEPQERMEGLINASDNATYNVRYSVSGQEAPGNANISVQGLENGEKYLVARETPGGEIVTTGYVLEDTTVTCTDEPSTGGLSCRVGGEEAIQKMLQIEEWSLENISYKGGRDVSERSCEQFSASVENSLNQGITGTGVEIGFCLDSENGFPSSIQVSSGDEEDLLDFSAIEVETDTGGVLELPQPLGVFPHCTDSFEIDLTPLKQVEEAEISLNGYSKVVELPERFEKGVYSIPEQRIDEGTNNITISSGGETQHKICYRRP